MVEDRDYGYAVILKGFEELGTKSISVGILKDAGKDEDGTDLVSIAVYNEYGTDDGHIPKRPAIRIGTDNNEEAWQDLMADCVGGIVDRRITPDQACQIVGARTKADIQKVYGSSELTENAESTIKHKKSDAPLIDTGRLRASVNYRVEG